MTVNSIVTWWLANGAATIAAIVGVIYGAKALAVALQKLVDLLPNHATADTYLGKFVRGCEAVAGLLSGLSPTPRATKSFAVRPAGDKTPKPRGFVVWPFLVFAIWGWSGTARAQVISSGPSLAFMEIRPQQPHPVEVAAGAGYQLSVGFFQRSLLGEQYDLLDIGATVYGSAISTPAGVSAGSLSAAAFVGTLNELLAIGVGIDLLGPGGGLLVAPGSVQPYLCVMLNLQRFAMGPYSPPTGVEPGALGLRRGLTTYLAW